MRRVWVVIASAALVAAVGCGQKSYERRLADTLAKLEYDRRLKKNLMEAPTDKKFQELTIYIRPPREQAQAKTGQLPITEGQFDLDASFNDSKDNSSSLHVLARVKMPKKPPAKGQPIPPPAPPRGEFVGEVLGVLSTAFNAPEALASPKLSDKESEKYHNRFKRLIFNAGDKEVALYTSKQGAHEVALVYVYDTKIKGPISSKIELSLDSFAIGEKAGRLYSGGEADEEVDSGPPVPL
jgi:hypothetical protein